MSGKVPNEEGLRALGDRSGAGGPGKIANEAGLLALGQEVDGSSKRRRGRGRHGAKTRHRGLKWGFGIAGLVVVLLAGSIAGYAWYLNSKVHRIGVKGLSDGPTQGADAGTENILMVGSTDRCALKVQNPAYGLCSEGVTGINSDVVMILHLNPSVPSVSVLSIPRDLFVPNARKDGANKIDAALVQGPSQLVAAVEEDFGIPIQHYVELNFDTFANVVDALGGINMYFPEPVYDAYSGLKVLTTGCLHLNGTEALQVVRARHLQYKGPGITTPYPQYWPQESQSDLARIRRDHEFLRVLASAVAKRGLSDPSTDLALVDAVAGQLTVDSGLSASHMVNLALTYHGVNIHNAPQLAVPVVVDQFGNYHYQGGDYGDIEFPTQPQDQSVVNQFLGVPTTTDTMSGTSLPATSSVTVSVLNGSGTSNQATDTANALGQLGFKVVGTGDSTPVGQEAETTVTYAKMTPADEAAAQAVARSMTGSVIMALGPTSDGAQVTVTTGTNFAVNPPAPPPSATTTTGQKKAAAAATPAPAPTTTTTAPPATGNGAFSAPSQAVEALAPWDPRSCTPSGGEGP
jgi:LCP family protein required for cell wall assembly